jgi:Tfp pilus assembly protein PilF
MNAVAKSYESDIDRLLTEVALAGGLYGLGEVIAPIAAYLKTQERTAGAASLAVGLALITRKDYAAAITVLKALADDPLQEKFHEEAAGFLALAYKLSGDIKSIDSVREKAPAHLITAVS